MESAESAMEKANPAYYRSRGKHIYHDFKTFSPCRRLAGACAVEFLKHAQGHEGELKIYEVGVGDGSFAHSFLEALSGTDSSVAKRCVYVLWDVSPKLLECAQERLRAFPTEAVCADAAETGRMKDAFWVRANEVLDDIPARVLVRRGGGICEVWKDGPGWRECKPGPVPQEVREYMDGAPQGRWIPLNLRAAGLLSEWEGKILHGGGISILDYGFAGLDEAALMPEGAWNGSVLRGYGGQYTVDVNFDFILKNCGGELEAQDGFVRRMCGDGLFAVELGNGMGYMDEREIELERKKLEGEGYDIELLKRGAEKNPYFHYFLGSMKK